MAVNTAKNNLASTTAPTSSLVVDRTSLWIALTTLVVILIIVVAGISVYFLLDQVVSCIILICLICLLAVLGIAALSALAIRNRRALAANDQGKVVTLRKGPYKSIAPSAPRDESWNYSNRETVRA